jgi:hypothetical protein
MGQQQGTSQVLRLSIGFPYNVLSLYTKPEVPWSAAKGHYKTSIVSNCCTLRQLCRGGSKEHRFNTRSTVYALCYVQLPTATLLPQALGSAHDSTELWRVFCQGQYFAREART